MTNADKIRAMSDEELAEFCAAQQADVFFRACDVVGVPHSLLDADRIIQAWLDWLKEEATE